MNIFSKTILIFLSLFFFTNQAYPITEDNDSIDLFHPSEIKTGSVLSVRDCISLAFKNSPHIKQKKYELDIAKSNLGLAKSAFFPILNIGAGFNYGRNSTGIYYDKKYRDLPYVNAMISQLVYDFGKTNANIRMEKFYKIAAEYEFMDEICHTLFDIKQKYYDLLRVSSLVLIMKKNLELAEEIKNIVKDEPDKTNSLYNLNNAKVMLIEKEKELVNVKYNLSNAMYLDNKIDYKIDYTPTFIINEDITSNPKNIQPLVFPFKNTEAIDIAYENSPDLKVIINTKNAMQEALKYAKKSYLPSVSLNAGYGYNRTYDAKNSNVLLNADISTDINAKEIKHSIELANAQLNIAENEINLFKKNLYFEVQRALNNVEKTSQELQYSKDALKISDKTYNIVKDCYKTNVTDYTELQQAREDYINSYIKYVNSLYEYNLALIQTEMALHFHIVDIQHNDKHSTHNHADILLEHLEEAINYIEVSDKNNKKSSKKNNRNKK